MKRTVNSGDGVYSNLVHKHSDGVRYLSLVGKTFFC